MSAIVELEIIEVENLSLAAWLELVYSPPKGKQFKNSEFPTDRHKEEYLATIHERSEEEVFRLLKKFLLASASLGIDEIALASLFAIKDADPDMFQRMIRLQYYQRLLLYSAGKSVSPPWEGNTWILDLLPYFPKDAINGLNSYIMAHIQQLPDGRLNGLFEAIEIIRARFIGLPGTASEAVDFISTLHWRDFEILVAKLYNKMGYKVEVTPPQKDQGRDILAHKEGPARQEHLRIECKHYVDEPVGIGIVQRLLGVVSGEKVNKGVLVTTSRFTGPAIKYAKENPRIELIAGDELILLLNEYLGPKWPQHIDRYIAEFRTSMIDPYD